MLKRVGFSIKLQVLFEMEIPDLGKYVDDLINLFDGWFGKGYLYMAIGLIVLFALWMFFLS